MKKIAMMLAALIIVAIGFVVLLLPIATSLTYNLTPEKIIITGVKIVPRPKPEKKVRIATTNAVIEMIKISMM